LYSFLDVFFQSVTRFILNIRFTEHNKSVLKHILFHLTGLSRVDVFYSIIQHVDSRWHSPAVLEVMDSCPSLGNISDFRIDTVSNAEGLEIVYVALWKFTETALVDYGQVDRSAGGELCASSKEVK